MPTARETIVNKALNGEEVQSLLRRDFDRLLQNTGLLQKHIAYGRIGWSVVLTLHLDNPYHSEDITRTRSTPAGRNVVAEHPERGAIEQFPLADVSAEADLVSQTLHREIDSPNAERIRSGLPLSAEVRNLDGTRTTEEITYPEDPSLGEGDVRITDTSDAERQAYDLLVRNSEKGA